MKSGSIFNQSNTDAEVYFENKINEIDQQIERIQTESAK